MTVSGFLIKIFIAVITSDPVKAMLAKLFADAAADVKAEIAKVEASMVASLEALPGVILGDATKDVGQLLHEITGTTNDIAGAVKGEVQPMLPTVDAITGGILHALTNLPGGGLLGGFFGK